MDITVPRHEDHSPSCRRVIRPVAAATGVGLTEPEALEPRAVGHMGVERVVTIDAVGGLGEWRGMARSDAVPALESVQVRRRAPLAPPRG